MGKKLFESMSDVLNFAEENQAPILTEHEGRMYANKEMLLLHDPEIDTLYVESLDSIVEYIKNTQEVLHKPYIITIDNPRQVSVRTSLNAKDNNRQVVMRAQADDYAPRFGDWLRLETAVIQLRSRYVETEHSKLLLAALGNVQKDEGVKVKDDGFSQTITTKKGASFENESLPNPAELTPYRSFVEIEQVSSEFLVRLDGNDLSIRFEEADGGVWKLEARKRIKEYLTLALDTEIATDDVVILA